MGRYISISFLVSSRGLGFLTRPICMPNLEGLVFPEQNTEDSNTESVESTLQ